MTPANPVEALALARAMREWLWLYPAVEIVHISGFVILVGSVAMFDLRVLGLSRAIPVRQLARHLLPWSVAALFLIVPSGLAMFAAHASDFLGNRAFQLKMALLLTAGLNAVAFHTGPYQTVAAWNTDVAAPWTAKASVALSLALWFSIISCGRLLAYL
ncbi:MAG TPA: DUF6644 family protein [Usitatibacter sp.]|nr:DUF6644 family protein [Usitatibacter sp.]